MSEKFCGKWIYVMIKLFICLFLSLIDNICIEKSWNCQTGKEKKNQGRTSIQSCFQWEEHLQKEYFKTWRHNIALHDTRTKLYLVLKIDRICINLTLDITQDLTISIWPCQRLLFTMFLAPNSIVRILTHYSPFFI